MIIEVEKDILIIYWKI